MEDLEKEASGGKRAKGQNQRASEKPEWKESYSDVVMRLRVLEREKKRIFALWDKFDAERAAQQQASTRQ